MKPRVCTACHQEKPLSEFYRTKQVKSGYLARCKACHKAAVTRRYRTMKADPALAEAYRAYQRLRYAKNPSKQRAAEARYRAKDPETFLHKARKRALKSIAKHHAKALQRSAAYKKAHPEIHAEHQRRRRALLLNAPVVEKIIAELIYKRDRWICQICFKRVARKDATLDHVVPLSKVGEHSYRNVVLAHFVCNSRKGNRAIPQQMRLLG